MANSGEFTTSSSNGRSVTFKWFVAAQNVETNKTTISWKLIGSGSFTGYVMAGNFKVKILGSQRYYSSSRIQLYQNTLISSGTYDIAHNADGTKTFDAYAEAGIYQVAVNCTGSGSWALPTIPRASTPSMSTTSLNIEASVNIYTNRASSAFKHTIRAVVGSWSKTLATNVASSFLWDTSIDKDDLYFQLSNSNSGSGRIYLDTYNGSSLLGTKYINFTLKVINSSPIFTEFIYEDVNPVTLAITENNLALIKNHSNLKVTIENFNKMIAINSATPKNYAATIGDVNGVVDYLDDNVSIDLGAVEQTLSNRLSVRAYDSRNNSTVVEKDVKIYDYSNPTIIASAVRLNNFEAQTTLKASGFFSTLKIDEIQKNTIILAQFRYRSSNGAFNTWSNFDFSIDFDQKKYICQDVILSLDNVDSFLIEIKITDKLSSTITTVAVDAGIPILFLSSNKKAVGVNCIPPQTALPGEIYSNDVNITYETGWIDCSYSNGFSQHSVNYAPLQIKRIGKMVYLRGSITNASTLDAGSSYLVGTFPSEHAPSFTHISVCQGSGIAKFIVYATRNGELIIDRYGYGTNYTSAGAGSWLNLYTSWLVG